MKEKGIADSCEAVIPYLSLKRKTLKLYHVFQLPKRKENMNNEIEIIKSYVSVNEAVKKEYARKQAEALIKGLKAHAEELTKAIQDLRNGTENIKEISNSLVILQWYLLDNISTIESVIKKNQ